MAKEKTRLPTAELLATLCERVYARPTESSSKWQDRLRQDLEVLEVIPQFFIDTSDVQLFVGYYYWNRIICIRGTDSEAEAVTNMLARRVADPVIEDVKVHSRFEQDASVIEEAFSRRRLDLNDGMRNWFTGHSRGGAVSLILAARSQYRYDQQPVPADRIATWQPQPRTNHAVTFSSPKAGNWSFAQHCEANVSHIRFQRAGDIVPLLPLAPMYWHDTPSQFFDSRRKFRPNATTLTRWFEWPAAIAQEASSPGIACVGLHNMRDMQKLIEKEESELQGGNLLRNLLI